MTYDEMKDFIGKRVEIPVHYDLWMRGARFGIVVGRRQGKAGRRPYLQVRMDHPAVRRCAKIWALDADYIRVL